MQRIGQTLGRSHTDAQARIGTRAFAHRHRVQILGTERRFTQNLIDKNGNLGGMIVAGTRLPSEKDSFA